MSCDVRRIALEELPLSERDIALQQNNPQRPTFLKTMIKLAHQKRASNNEIISAFNEVSTLKMMPNLATTLAARTVLSLSEAFAVLMEPVSLKELGKYRLMLLKLL